jgi:hypothetical protein
MAVKARSSTTTGSNELLEKAFKCGYSLLFGDGREIHRVSSGG